MADSTRKKYLKQVTPAGRAIYPRLNEPDTKFKDEGTYSVRLALSGEDAQGLIDSIEEVKAEALEMANEMKKGKKKTKEADLPYADVLDEDENETGEIAFHFKMTASGLSKKTGKKWERRPALFDAKTKRLDPEKTQIWGGSILKVSYTAEPFYVPALGAGVTLRLHGVQVLELVSGGEQTAESMGFGEEDGFEGAESARNEDVNEDTEAEEEEAQEGEEDF